MAPRAILSTPCHVKDVQQLERIQVSGLPVIAKELRVDVEDLIGKPLKAAKRGPTGKLQQHMEEVSRLPTKRCDGQLFAQWQCIAYDLQLLRELTTQDHAIDLGGGGYPLRYTAQAKHVLPKLIDGEPPHANPRCLHGEGDIVQGYEHRKMQRKDEAIAACPPDAWLLVEAWNES